MTTPQTSGGKTLAERIAALSPKQRAVLELKRARQQRAQPEKASVPRRQGPGPWPASTDQTALWFIQQLDPDTSAYNIGNGFRLQGTLDVPLLERCFSEMVMRHEALRTTFRSIDGRPYQAISETANAHIQFTDVRAEEDPDAAARPLLTEQIKAPFDLETGPLVRLLLVRIGEDDYVMVGVMHHAITDWWSYHLFFDELFRLYEATRRGRPNPLPPIPIQFVDWCVGRQEWLRSTAFDQQLAYWLHKLEGVPQVLEVLGDRPRPPVQSAEGVREFFKLPKTISRSLRQMNHDANTSSFMTLLAGIGVLMWRYTGQQDMLIGTPSSFDRESEETRYLMGYLLNTLVLRIDLRDDPSFRQLLRMVRTTCLEGFANKELPFRTLVEKLNPERDLSRMPVYQVEYLYISENSPLAHEQRLDGAEMPDFKLSSFGIDRKTSPVDLQITFSEAPQQYYFLIEYNRDIFEPATIRRLGGHMERLLARLAGQPDIPISKLPWVEDAERHQIVSTWNEDHWPPAPEKPLHRAFERQAARTPGATAVRLLDQGSLTYGELDARANRLAAHLRRMGVGPETRVGLATSRSLDMMVGLYGILKAGAAYLPLDPSYPPSRLELMIEDGQVAVLLTEQRLIGDLPSAKVPCVCLDRPLDRPPTDPGGTCESRFDTAIDLDAAADLDALTERDTAVELDAAADLDTLTERDTAVELDAAAYVIYTSGSTGRPKGVVVSHRNAVNFQSWLARFLGRDELAVTLASTSLSFDISQIELFTPLAVGGTVVLVDNLLALPSLPPDLGLTMINTVPSAMTGLLGLSGVPTTVKTVLLGGEALGRPLVQRLGEQSRVQRIVNVYGPTETTVYSLFRPLTREEEGTVTIGSPLAGTQAYVLDRKLEPVPVGIPGELCLGGRGVARGYHRRPGLTATRFVPDPFGAESERPEPGRRLYHTGDLARRRDDGEVEFLGRADHQVKIRGFRIEMGEVETALATLPGVRAAAAEVRSTKCADGASESYIAAYLIVEADLELDTATLRAQLAERLPHYMIPTAFARLDELPLLPNGKVNRKALPEAQSISVAEDHVAPRTDTERRLATIWSEVLELDQVGVHANFFDLGGHSLRATQVVSRLRQSLGFDLTLRDLFDAPTLAELAARLDADGSETGSASDHRSELTDDTIPQLPRLALEEGVTSENREPMLDLPLSSAQQRLWFLDRLEGPNAAYNMPAAIELSGRLDSRALTRTLSEIVRRHEVLRTTFPERDGQPHQRIARPAPFPLPHVDLRALERRAQQDEAQRLTWAEATRPFDLSSDSLLRATLLHTDVESHTLLITMHHIVSDGWSIGVFIHELSTLYGAFHRGRPSPLAELPIQYADFSHWQRQWLSEDVLAAQIDYWRHQLKGAPPALELPSDRPRPAIQTHHGGLESLRFGADLEAALKRTVLNSQTTLYIASLTAFLALMSRSTGQRDVVVGSPIANRGRPEIEGLIGFFVNSLVMRADLSGNPRFRDLLERVRNLALDAYAHQDLPFEQLVEELKPQRDLSRHPLFQVSFVVQNAPFQEMRLPGLVLSPADSDFVATRFDLELNLRELDGRLQGVLIYNADLFDATTVRRLARHYEALLSGATAGPDRRLHDLPMLLASERHQLCREWQAAPPVARPNLCLPQLFERQVDRAPGAIAVELEDVTQTFQQLDEGANRLAHHLRRIGIGPEAIVALYLDRSPEQLIAVLAVLKAGAAYLPLDRGLPRRRLATLLDDAQALAVLTRKDLTVDLPATAATVLYVDDDTLAEQSTRRPLVDAHSDQPAYVLYTSGSTGRPKGVAVSHRAAAGYLTWAVEAYRVDRSARGAPLHSSLSFDLTLTSLFAPLLAGRRVTLLRETDALGDLAELMRDARDYAFIKLTPSHLEVLSRQLVDGEMHGPALLILGGEALAAESLAFWRQRLPATQLINEYGPTEATVGCTIHEVSPSDPEVGPVSIGRPIAGARIHLVDRRVRPMPLGSVGEILIGGPGLARGYLHQPRLSAANFVPDPFAQSPGSRLYRTGDLARLRSGGSLDFLGRRDHQLKVRGFRIEPGEIETALNTHPEIQDAVVLAADRDRLAACVVPRHTLASPPLSEVLQAESKDPRRRRALDQLLPRWKSFLAEQFPEHMVPSTFVVLDELPLLPSGKVDRKILRQRATDGERSEPEASFVAPRTATEETLATIWSEVLGVQPIGVQDDFFRLGGHSLLATQVASRLRQSLGLEVPLRTLFERTTIATLAETLEATTHASAKPTIEPAPRGDDLPLSFAQQRLWFLDQLEGPNPTYNMAAALELRGRLDIEALRRSLGGIVRRHEVLRTRFPKIEGRARQVIDPATAFTLPRVDLCRLTAEDRASEARRLAGAETLRPFDLAQDPMLRATLLLLDAGSNVLTSAMHHIASDGWSIGLLVDELTALYTAFSKGQSPPLTELEVQYADFAVWQRRWITERSLEASMDYWRRQLAEAPALLELPTDRPRPATQTFRGGVELIPFDAELSERLQALSQQRDVTLFMTLLAGFATLLGRYSGQNDIVVGSPIAGRTRQEIEPLIGFFVNTLVLRTQLASTSTQSAPTFDELLAQVQRTALDAYSHQDVPFERLVEELRPERSLSHSTLFQVMFALQNVPVGQLQLPGLTLKPLDLEARTSKFDLSLFCSKDEHGVSGFFEYNRDLFDASTVQRMGRAWMTLLAAAAANPEQSIYELPLLDDGERHQILFASNATDQLHPPGAVHELIAAQAAQCGSATAIETWAQSKLDQALTYHELSRLSARLASHLRSLGLAPETRIAVALERSPDMLVALLAVLEAGGAYLPLDPTWPDARLAMMLEDSNASHILTEERLLARWAKQSLPTICLDRDFADPEIDLDPRAPLPKRTNQPTDPASLAYVIYTSGSTGRPKGVQISHGALANFLHAMRQAPGLTQDDVLVAVTTLSFDIAALELLLPLVTGAKVVVATREQATDGRLLGELLRVAGVTVLQATPATWRLLLASGWTGEPRLKMLCGGEALPRDLAASLEPLGRQLWNLYGPTETTVWSSTFQRLAGSRQDGTESIGWPIANTRLHVLGPLHQPVPIGVPGDLVIGGDGLARGYLDRAGLTAECFFPNPYAREPGCRLYQTGDRARYLDNGSLEYLGRRDHQVKIRGFRIELGEIEAVMSEHPAVATAVAAVRGDTPGDARLVAYLVSAAPPNDANEDAEQLAEWQQVWNATYRQPGEITDPALNTRGWISSLTGLPIPEIEMREWAEATTHRILSRKPRRLLEIGCGTGMLLFRLAPHLESYHGTDLSGDAIDYVEQQLTSMGPPWPDSRVTLERRPAHELDDLGDFDAVVLNSVVQYFPSASYLLQVLEAMMPRVAPGGFIFLGDLRSLPLLSAFHATAQLAQAADSTTSTELRRSLRLRQDQEEELVLDPKFFQALARQHPKIRAIDLEIKRGRHANEMNCFRYDVTLHLDPENAAAGTKPVSFGGSARTEARIEWQDNAIFDSDLRKLLSAQAVDGQIVELCGVPNARLTAACELVRRLNSDEEATAGDLRAELATLPNGVDPEDVRSLAEELGLYVQLTFSEDPSRFDARFSDRRESTSLPLETSESAPTPTRFNAFANNPQSGKLARQIAPQLRTRLRQKLPEYMVPSAFVLLDELPLTANGKIDRAALTREAPTGSELATAGAVPPRNELELELAGIFEELLGISSVGVGDNFFDLGGHSLLAVQLIDRIQRRFGHNLPLTTLFDAPSIDQLATRLRQQGDGLDFSPLVILRKDGTRPPLFCVHPAGGNVLCYRDLAHALGPEQPFYGLRAYGLVEGQRPLPSIEAMAKRYVEWAIAEWPEGPFMLAGWSHGGFIAFEMARQLEEMGREVALLAILDAFPDEAYPDPDKWRGADDAEIFVKMLPASSLSVETLRRLNAEQQLAQVAEEAMRLGFVPPDLLMSDVCRYLDFFKTNMRMRYAPRPYRGRITLFHVAEHEDADTSELLEAWQAYAAAGVEAHLIPGEHETLIAPPHVAALAAKLDRCIENVLSKRP